MENLKYFKFLNPNIDKLISDDFFNNVNNFAYLNNNAEYVKSYFNGIEKEIALSIFGKQSISYNKGWIGIYSKGTTCEFHNHTDLDKSSHVLIQVLETGDNAEFMIVKDAENNNVNVKMEKGDIIIFSIETIHGVENISEKLKFIFLGISFN